MQTVLLIYLDGLHRKGEKEVANKASSLRAVAGQRLGTGDSSIIHHNKQDGTGDYLFHSDLAPGPRSQSVVAVLHR